MIKAVITDIEGTTSSLSFVKDCLFPYARTHIGAFVQANEQNPQVQSLLADVCHEVGQSLTNAQIISQLVQWIDEDVKATPLKSLQGLIWEAGYQNGELTGHLYPDAIQHLKAWKANGLDLYIYSSGSVYAQKLLFGHTEAGDLTPLFSGYFDTHIGAKQDVRSYESIAADIGLPAKELVFLSDMEAELDAAKTAGLYTVWLTRAALPNTNASHWQVQTFDDINFSRFE